MSKVKSTKKKKKDTKKKATHISKLSSKKAKVVRRDIQMARDEGLHLKDGKQIYYIYVWHIHKTYYARVLEYLSLTSFQAAKVYKSSDKRKVINAAKKWIKDNNGYRMITKDGNGKKTIGVSHMTEEEWESYKEATKWLRKNKVIVSVKGKGMEAEVKNAEKVK